MLLIISRKTLSLLATLLLPVLLASNASASLLISPTRLSFAERERSSKVFLMNTSSETKTYRLEFQQQKQLPDGRYQALDHHSALRQMQDHKHGTTTCICVTIPQAAPAICGTMRQAAARGSL